MKRTMLAVAALLVVGCGEADGPLLLAYRGDEVGRQGAELAVEEWRSTCAVDVRLDPAGILLEGTAEGLPADRGGATHEVGGQVAWIRFRPVPDVEATRSIIAHEIGHALGLEHTAPGVEDLMAEELTSVRHVTLADCAALATVER